MARQTLILAKSSREAGSYAKLAGLDRFTYRAVSSAGAIKGTRNAEVHILPSFFKRIDRHNILSALRWAKIEVFYVDPADFAEDESEPVSYPDKYPTGPTFPALSEEGLEAAYAEDAERETPSDGGQPPENESDEEKPRTRRRRCSTGEHLVDARSLEAHEESEHATPAAPVAPANDFFS